MKPDEIDRRFRVADQMATIYSVLRDRYASRATRLTLAIMGSSVVLCACTFLPDDALAAVGISPLGTKIVLGGFSSLILFLSIAELKVDWKERSRTYGEAADSVVSLKAGYRNIRNSSEAPSTDIIRDLTSKYDTIMTSLPGVPDAQFAKLKAYHLTKIKLSQMIDSSPGCPLWILRLKLMWQGFHGGKRA